MVGRPNPGTVRDGEIHHSRNSLHLEPLRPQVPVSAINRLKERSIIIYDGRGNPVKMINALGNTTSFTHSDDRRLTSLTDARGARREFL